MRLAMADAKGESRSAWRGGAIRETIELHAEIGEVDVAIELARKMRSPAGQRITLAPLLARQERWGELHEVLAGAATALEASDLCYAVKFVWAPAR